MTVAAVLVVAGVVGLSVFGWLVWPPLVVLPISVACLAAGLLIDWEAPRGKSAPSHHPPQ